MVTIQECGLFNLNVEGSTILNPEQISFQKVFGIVLQLKGANGHTHTTLMVLLQSAITARWQSTPNMLRSGYTAPITRVPSPLHQSKTQKWFLQVR